jgi:hypothetical protein
VDAFDPEKYVAEKTGAKDDFDPEKYLAEKGVAVKAPAVPAAASSYVPHEGDSVPLRPQVSTWAGRALNFLNGQTAGRAAKTVGDAVTSIQAVKNLVGQGDPNEKHPIRNALISQEWQKRLGMSDADGFNAVEHAGQQAEQDTAARLALSRKQDPVGSAVGSFAGNLADPVNAVGGGLGTLGHMALGGFQGGRQAYNATDGDAKETALGTGTGAGMAALNSNPYTGGLLAAYMGGKALLGNGDTADRVEEGLSGALGLLSHGSGLAGRGANKAAEVVRNANEEHNQNLKSVYEPLMAERSGLRQDVVAGQEALRKSAEDTVARESALKEKQGEKRVSLQESLEERKAKALASAQGDKEKFMGGLYGKAEDLEGERLTKQQADLKMLRERLLEKAKQKQTAILGEAENRQKATKESNAAFIDAFTKQERAAGRAGTGVSDESVDPYESAAGVVRARDIQPLYPFLNNESMLAENGHVLSSKAQQGKQVILPKYLENYSGKLEDLAPRPGEKPEDVIPRMVREEMDRRAGKGRGTSPGLPADATVVKAPDPEVLQSHMRTPEQDLRLHMTPEEEALVARGSTPDHASKEARQAALLSTLTPEERRAALRENNLGRFLDPKDGEGADFHKAVDERERWSSAHDALLRANEAERQALGIVTPTPDENPWHAALRTAQEQAAETQQRAGTETNAATPTAKAAGNDPEPTLITPKKTGLFGQGVKKGAPGRNPLENYAAEEPRDTPDLARQHRSLDEEATALAGDIARERAAGREHALPEVLRPEDRVPNDPRVQKGARTLSRYEEKAASQVDKLRAKAEAQKAELLQHLLEKREALKSARPIEAAAADKLKPATTLGQALWDGVSSKAGLAEMGAGLYGGQQSGHTTLGPALGVAGAALTGIAGAAKVDPVFRARLFAPVEKVLGASSQLDAKWGKYLRPALAAQNAKAVIQLQAAMKQDPELAAAVERARGSH